MISIDVFDTALFRVVPKPADVFEIVGVRLRIDNDRDDVSFRERRVQAELRARVKNSRRDIEEVTLDEIYDELKQALPQLDVARSMACELDVERAACVVNPDVLRLYRSVIASGVKLVFTSDTYFPQTFVSELLRQAGYDADHRCFTSSTYRATKEKGSLFAIIAREMGVEPKAITHLGDNWQADFVSARRRGVKGYWYRPRTRRLHDRSSETLAERTITRIAEVRVDDQLGTGDSIQARTGYDIAGPIFVGLFDWLVTDIKRAPVDLVLFCARDGLFMRDLYERVRAQRELPPSQYFEVSRRSLAFPSITELDVVALNVITANNSPLPVSEFFARIGLDVNQYLEAYQRVGLSATTIIKDDFSRKQLEDVFRSIEPAIVERAASERELLTAYLQQCGILDAKRIAIFDIGWGGTLQRAVANVLGSLGEPRSLVGYYLSTDERILRLDAKAGPASGWFANAAEPSSRQRPISAAYWLLETIFSALHGTTLGYRRDGDGKIVPVRHVFDSEASDARATARIQRAAVDFTVIWERLWGDAAPAINAEMAFRRFERFAMTPSLEEAQHFGNVLHIGGMGTTNETMAIARPPHVTQALRRPKIVLSAYRTSLWRRGYLKRVVRAGPLLRALHGMRSLGQRLRIRAASATGSPAHRRD